MRGVGGKSAALGSFQKQGIHVDEPLNLEANLGAIRAGVVGYGGWSPGSSALRGEGVSTSGRFAYGDSYNFLYTGEWKAFRKPPYARDQGGTKNHPGSYAQSKSTTTIQARLYTEAGETRPDNVAVRIFIKAKE